jgi:hypothetical protein
MDPKVIEMNNLRVLNDYLNQTLDVLVRGQRLAGGPGVGLGYSPFAGGVPGAVGGLGTDVVYGVSPFGFAGAHPFGGHSPYPAVSQPFGGHSPYAAVNPFTGSSLMGGAGYASSFGAFQPPPWGQTPWGASQTPWGAGQPSWTPNVEAARQAQVTQTLAAKQSVLEAMCRVAGIQV